jgi:hypothetical protein
MVKTAAKKCLKEGISRGQQSIPTSNHLLVSECLGSATVMVTFWHLSEPLRRFDASLVVNRAEKRRETLHNVADWTQRVTSTTRTVYSILAEIQNFGQMTYHRQCST